MEEYNDAYYGDADVAELEKIHVSEKELEEFEQGDNAKTFHSYTLNETWDLTNYRDNEDIIRRLKTDTNLTTDEKGELMYVLIRKNMRIVYKIISKKAKPFILANEDLYFEGLGSIKKAIDRYEFGRGTKFSTFLYYVVENDIKALIKKASVEYNRTIAMDKVRAVDNRGNEQTLEDIIPDDGLLPSDSWKSGENIKAVNEALKSLSIQERYIICKSFEMRGLEKSTQEDLGDYMDISQVTVATYQKNGMDTLAHVFRDMGISLSDLAYLFTSN